MKLYRVIKQVTKSRQPINTHWATDVLYCGYDREEARQVYWQNEPEEDFGGFGNRSVRVLSQVIDDAGTDNFVDDELAEQEMT